MGVIILVGLYLDLVVHTHVFHEIPVSLRLTIRSLLIHGDLPVKPLPRCLSVLRMGGHAYFFAPIHIPGGRREVLGIPFSHLPQKPQKGRQKEEVYSELQWQSAQSFQGLAGKNSKELGMLVKWGRGGVPEATRVMDLSPRAPDEASRFLCHRTKDYIRVKWLQTETEAIIKKGKSLLRMEVSEGKHAQEC
jgi:hypothetical protein